MTESAVDAAKAQPLALHEWADLPLHRVVVTAAVHRSGTLHPVGAVAEKAERAAVEPGVVALAVHQDQRKEVPWADKTAGKPSVIGATTLGWLANELAVRAGAAAYGPVVPLPAVLQQASPDHAGPWQRSFDYRAESYRGLNWLDERVLQALQAPAQASDDATEPPEGELRKYANRGYIHILATASSGKTSWALNWVRQSTGELPAGRLPPLAGWYFARRQGQGAVEHGSELHALQNLISLARRQRDVLPRAAGAADPPDTPLNLLSKDEADAFHAQPDANHERRLSERFRQALNALTEDSPPSPERPLVFLIDGGDEMWGPGTRFQRWNFPHVLPTMAELPEHVYVVLLSRPGPHMLGFHHKVPLLRYVFAREDVDRSIRDHLNSLAEAWEDKLPGNEATTLLRRPSLADNICNASEGAFGYVTLLMREWLPRWDEEAYRGPIEHDLDTLRRWCERPESLPEGIYGLRAEEFLALQDRPNPQAAGLQVSLAEALALVGQLRWPLSRHQLLELLYPGAALYGQADPLRDSLRDQLRRGSIWLVGTGTEDEHEPMRFGHLCLQETALAAWRLQVLNRRLDRHALAQEARLVAEQDQGDPGDMSPDAVARRMALAQLHAMLGGALKHAREPAWLECVALKRPPLGPNCMLDEATAYDWTWGPVHAVMAGVLTTTRSGHAREPHWMRRSRQVRELLIDASFLQSAIRAQVAHSRKTGRAVDALALREAYILAERLQGEDAELTLRNQVEAALLQWYDRAADGTLQLGGLLWNMLGAVDVSRFRAQRWRDSIDKPALITSLPGKPSAVLRQIAAMNSAVSPCGDWLVTSDGHSKTEVWDLRAGRHRAVVYLQLPLAPRGKIEVVAEGDQLCIAAIQSFDICLLLVVTVSIRCRTYVSSTYGGSTGLLIALKLSSVKNSRGLRDWLVVSASSQGDIALLVRSDEQISMDSRRLANETDSRLEFSSLIKLGIYGQLCCIATGLSYNGGRAILGVAIGSDHGVSHLLLLPVEKISDHGVSGFQYIGNGRFWDLKNESPINTISLTVHKAETEAIWALASGTEDGSIHVHFLFGRLIQDAWRSRWEEKSEILHPERQRLLRLDGTRDAVSSIHLFTVDIKNSFNWVIVGGSQSGSVTFSIRSEEEILKDQGTSIEQVDLVLPLHSTTVQFIQVNRQADREPSEWTLFSASDDGELRLNVFSVDRFLQNKFRRRLGCADDVEMRSAGHSLCGGQIGSMHLSWGQTSGYQFLPGVCLRTNGTVEILGVFPRLIEERDSPLEIGQGNDFTNQFVEFLGHESEISCVRLNSATISTRTAWAITSTDREGSIGFAQFQGSRALRYPSDPKDPLVTSPSLTPMQIIRGTSGKAYSLETLLSAQHGTTLWVTAIGTGHSCIGIVLHGIHSSFANVDRRLLSKSGQWTGRILVHGDGIVSSISLRQAASSLDPLLLAYGAPTREIVFEKIHIGAPDQRDPPYSLLPDRVVVDLGYKLRVTAVCVQSAPDNCDPAIAIASGSADNSVGLIVLSGHKSREGHSSSSGFPTSINRIIKYAGHWTAVSSVAIQFGGIGKQKFIALLSGSQDGTICFSVCACDLPGEDLGASTSNGKEESLQEISPLMSRQSGLAGGVQIRSIDAPKGSPTSSMTACVHYWIVGNSTAASIWSSTISEITQTLDLVHVVPITVAGLKAMDFAQAADRENYAIGGALGSSVAVIELEMHNP